MSHKKLASLNKNIKQTPINEEVDNFIFPDLLENETQHQVQRNSIGTKRSRLPALGVKAKAFTVSGNLTKSKREITRDALISKANTYNKIHEQAGKPTSAEIQKTEQLKVDEQKMRVIVKKVLNDLMESIVVEVSLKLGGAMHAQGDAIKSIVDKYLNKNPVIEEKLSSLQEDCRGSIYKEIDKVRQNLRASIPNDVLKTIEQGTLSQLKMEMDKIENHIDLVRAATGVTSTIVDNHKQQIGELEKKIGSFPTELESSSIAQSNKAQDYTRMYCDEKVDVVQQTINETSDKLQTTLKQLADLEVKDDVKSGAQTGHQDAIKQLQADIEILQKKGCCTIM